MAGLSNHVKLWGEFGYLVLLVEGEEDVVLLKSWIEAKSRKIKNSIENANLIIDHLGGASNVGYKTSLYKNNLCNVVAYLDNDEAGRKGIENAKKKGIIKTNEYILSFVTGMKNSELEDLLDVNSYRQLIIDEYGVDLNIPKFKNNKKQWSTRVEEIFKLNGKMWSDKLESEIKYKVAKKAAEIKEASLHPQKANSITTLVNTIEIFLDKMK